MFGRRCWMRVGIDTDFLVCLSVREHQRHQAALLLHDRLLERGAIWVLVPQIVSEFLHVVTDGKRFEKPLTMEEGLIAVDYWIGVSDFISPEVSSLSRLAEEMRRHHLGRKRILDTLFATTLLEAGVAEVVTGNGKDYRLFEGLTIHEF